MKVKVRLTLRALRLSLWSIIISYTWLQCSNSRHYPNSDERVWSESTDLVGGEQDVHLRSKQPLHFKIGSPTSHLLWATQSISTIWFHLVISSIKSNKIPLTVQDNNCKDRGTTNGHMQTHQHHPPIHSILPFANPP